MVQMKNERMQTECVERKVWPPPDRPLGLVCPKCGCADMRVLNTRYVADRIVRYRQCRHCGRKATSYEVLPAKLADPARDGRRGARPDGRR